MKRYYITDTNKHLVEVTENEFIAVMGTKDIRKYVSKVYRNTMSISDVPAELQEQVQTTVNNRIARFGEHQPKATEEDLYNALAELGVTND